MLFDSLIIFEKIRAPDARFQDIFTNQFKHKRSGNDILKSSLEIGTKEGLKPQIYTHPLGTFGHSAGTTIGMWDSQHISDNGRQFSSRDFSSTRDCVPMCSLVLCP